jgi:hypothetical protein
MQDNAIVITDRELKSTIDSASKSLGLGRLTHEQQATAMLHLVAAWDDLIAENLNRLATEAVDKTVN